MVTRVSIPTTCSRDRWVRSVASARKVFFARSLLGSDIREVLVPKAHTGTCRQHVGAVDAESRPLVDTLRAQSTRLYGNFWGSLFSAQYTLPYLFLKLGDVAAAVARLLFPVVCFHIQVRSAPEAGASVAAAL